MDFGEELGYQRKGNKASKLAFQRQNDDFFAMRKRPVPYVSFTEALKSDKNTLCVHLAKEQQRTEHVADEGKH